ncbi:MAG: DUF3488 and transglutaminase-like domain-containing protein [Xanthomonadaceae bacterium]|nr:DUF3488 and transglutaminase-like domain-containing protein [Xanthomonadaceae bacterium]
MSTARSPATGKLSRKTVFLVVAAFVVAVLPHLGNMPAWLAAVILLAALWRAAAAYLQMGPPHWLLRIGLTFAGLAAVVLNFGIFWGRRAATVLLCLMMAAKLMEMFRLRDARIVASLCFFLIATQFLFSEKLILIAYLIVGCWLAVVALVQIQRDEDQSAAPGGTNRPRAAFVEGALMLLMAAPFAIALFTLFPRLGSPLWGVPEQALDGKSGLSDTMEPGSIISLFMDDSPAFRVEFDGAMPERQQLYWRGPVLWSFNGRSWRRLFGSEERTASRLPASHGATIDYRVQLEPNERNWLFALDYPARWPDDSRVTPDYELIRNQPVTTLTSYRVQSQPDFIDSPELSVGLKQAALQFPDDSNPRTRALALDLRRRHADDRALVDAVLTWFNQEAFFYSLDTVPLGRHGADEFLFDLRSGYCEYYASAFVLLMRAAGIPARVVTGYQGGFWQQSGGYLLVRQSDAHAWAEVWLADQGWVRVDPTAAVSPSRILDGARGALDVRRGWLDVDWVYRLRNQFDRLQHAWNRWVLGYDARRQNEMLSKFGLNGLSLAAQAVLIIVAAALALLPLVWLLTGPLAGFRSRDPLERAWLRLRRRIRKAGISVAAGETPLELARHASSRLANGHELVTLADRYCLARYSSPNPEQARLIERQTLQWRPRLNSPRPKSV